MPLVCGSLLLVSTAISRVDSMIGVPSGSFASANPPKLFSVFTAVSVAPILEEVNFRISILGTIVAFVILTGTGLTKKMSTEKVVSTVILSFYNPRTAKESAGFRYDRASNIFGSISGVEWFMLFVTSIVFGTAHLGSQAGWEVGKTVTAAVSGFVIGLVFLTYGVCASILVHWFMDYYLDLFYFISQEASGRFLALNTLLEWVSLSIGICAVALIAGSIFQNRKRRGLFWLPQVKILTSSIAQCELDAVDPSLQHLLR